MPINPMPPNQTNPQCSYNEHKDLDYIYQLLQGQLNGMNIPSVTNTLSVSDAVLATAIGLMITAAGANQVTFYQVIFNSVDSKFYIIFSLNTI